MGELTPNNALQHYRLNSPPEANEQASMFREMSTKDALELLFYMATHNVMTIQHVHGLIDPEAAETEGMPDDIARN